MHLFSQYVPEQSVAASLSPSNRRGIHKKWLWFDLWAPQGQSVPSPASRWGAPKKSEMKILARLTQITISLENPTKIFVSNSNDFYFVASNGTLLWLLSIIVQKWRFFVFEWWVLFLRSLPFSWIFSMIGRFSFISLTFPFVIRFPSGKKHRTAEW